MKTTMKVLAVCAILLAALQPTAAGAAADGYKFKGRGVNVYVYQDDPSGCIFSSMWVFGAEEMLRELHQSRNSSTRVMVWLYRYDRCTDMVFSAEGSAPLSKTDLQIDGNLDRATLKTTVKVHDSFSNTSFDVHIDLTWTGTGPITRENSQYHYSAEDFQIRQHLKSDNRFAQVTGTVTDGTTNYMPAWLIEDGTIFNAQDGVIAQGSE